MELAEGVRCLHPWGKLGQFTRKYFEGSHAFRPDLNLGGESRRFVALAGAFRILVVL